MKWSWVATETDVGRVREKAAALVGMRLSSVRYICLDYALLDRTRESRGPRLVDAPAELAEPAWRYDTYDCADFAVELTMQGGRVFTCSWDAPGHTEGIWLREVPARGAGFLADADVAVWDVSHAGRWDAFIGEEITDVTLHYQPWGDEGFWCPRITMACAAGLVHLLLGEAGDPAGDSRAPLVPSADNIAVLFSPQTSAPGCLRPTTADGAPPESRKCPRRPATSWTWPPGSQPTECNWS